MPQAATAKEVGFGISAAMNRCVAATKDISMNKRELTRSQCIATLAVALSERPIGCSNGTTVERSPSSFYRSTRRRNVHEVLTSATGGSKESIKSWGECRPATAETAGQGIRNLRDQKRQTARLHAGGPAAEAYSVEPEDSALRLSITPLSDSARILRRMATQAITPALLDLLDILSSPILLIEDRPAGELRLMPPARLVLVEAA